MGDTLEAYFRLVEEQGGAVVKGTYLYLILTYRAYGN